MKNFLIRTIPYMKSFLVTFSLLRITGIKTTNVISIIFYLLFNCLIHLFDSMIARENDNRHSKRSAVVLCCIFSFLYFAGSFELICDGLDFVLFQFVVSALTISGLLILFYYGIRMVFMMIDRTCIQNNRTVGKRTVLMTFPIFIICWTPYLLMNLPGIVTTDTVNQFAQVLRIWQQSNHHPWVHTQLIRLFYHIGFFITKDTSRALIFYTVFQMLFLSGCITYLIATLRMISIRRAVIYVFIAFYALVPYHAIYSVTLWKDTMFAGSALVFTVTLFRILYRKQHGSMGRDFLPEWITYTVSAIVFSLFRSNGWYAFLFMIPFLLWTFRKQWKVFLPLEITVIAIVLFIKGPVMTYYQVAQPDILESLAIPTQQIARVLVNDETLTEEQNAYFDTIIDINQLKERYDPQVADGFKNLVREKNLDYFTSHIKEFFSIYIQLGIKYPLEYLTAFRDQTIGYWYPDQDGIIAGDSGVLDNEFGIEDIFIIKGQAAIKFNEIQLKLKDMIPGYGLLWSMGSITWCMLFALVYLLKKNMALATNEKPSFHLIYLPGIAICLTLIAATPVANDFRYAYGYIICLPFYLIIPFLKSEEGKEKG